MCVSALGKWRSDVRLLLLSVMMMLSVSGCSSMDVTVPNKIHVMNGSDIKIPCSFTSCYQIDTNKFVMNWTYHESINDTEKMFLAYDRKKGMVALLPERFGERVLFAGNLAKNDLSITLLDVQEEDEGIYNCYVINPRTAYMDTGPSTLKFRLNFPPRDSTIAVAIGASVGGALALLILSMVVVKFLRHHLKQDLTEEEKMEEEGKLEAEGAADEGTKQT